jgi:hypothetical protein
MATLLRTGARVNSVDEEGEVSLFCYSLGRSFAFRSGDVARWGALIGKPITIEVSDEAYEADLYECDVCSAKPGMATLCRDCLDKRAKAGSAWRGQRRTEAAKETP